MIRGFPSKFQRCFKPHLPFPRKVLKKKGIYKGKAGGEGVVICFYGNKDTLHDIIREAENARDSKRLFLTWWLKYSPSSAF